MIRIGSVDVHRPMASGARREGDALQAIRPRVAMDDRFRR
jgi:hypothetical protein